MQTLADASFLTGWILTTGIAVLACFWWFPRFDAAGLPKRMRLHLGLGLLLVLLYALHAELRIPTGWIEGLLLCLLALLVTSTVAGVVLVRDRAGSPERVRRWVHVHVPLTYALLGAALFHGVFVHGHGMLAHVFLGK